MYERSIHIINMAYTIKKEVENSINKMGKVEMQGSQFKNDWIVATSIWNGWFWMKRFEYHIYELTYFVSRGTCSVECLHGIWRDGALLEQNIYELDAKSRLKKLYIRRYKS